MNSKLVSTVAAYAERFFAFGHQVILVLRSHGIVTGDTGNHLTSIGVQDFRSNWMGECSLVFVTLDTDIVPVPPQQRQITTAMGLVAATAVFYAGMPG